MPVIMAGLDHRTVWRFTGAVLGLGFLHARCCTTCVLVQAVFYTVAFPQLQFFTVFVVAFTLCSLSLSAGPCYQASTCLDHCWKCSSWTSCSRPSLYNARCRLCPGNVQRCPWRHYRQARHEVHTRFACRCPWEVRICWLLFCSRFSNLSFTVMLLLFVLCVLFSAVYPVAVIALFGGDYSVLSLRLTLSLGGTRSRADPVLVSLLNGESVFVRRRGHRALHLLGETH